jgi:hypothetical protein
MVETVMDDHQSAQMNDYAMTKWVNEMQVRNSALRYGTESVVVRLFNTFGPGEYYSPYRSVNCRFLYCALNGLPWTVFRGHSRTSTFLPDTVRTLANITDNFRPGETYNIGGTHHHTIEELSNAVLKVTGASSSLPQYLETESLTTHHQLVDVSKATRDSLTVTRTAWKKAFASPLIGCAGSTTFLLILLRLERAPEMTVALPHDAERVLWRRLATLHWRVPTLQSSWRGDPSETVARPTSGKFLTIIASQLGMKASPTTDLLKCRYIVFPVLVALQTCG